MKVLLVEDDKETADFICQGLRDHQCQVRLVETARDGILAASTDDFDVVIFDRLLPNMDGMDAVRILRSSSIETPIILLTALSGIDDRVAGLEAGADDYMVKPFAFDELHARLRALARRQPIHKQDAVLTAADLRLDKTSRQVTREGIVLDLLPKEYAILELFLTHQDQLVTRTMLLEQVWGFSFDPKTSLVQTHVSRLRTKVDKPFKQELIKTVRGSGYVLSAAH